MADREAAAVDCEEGWEECRRCQVMMGGEEDAVVPGVQVLVAGFVYLGGDGIQGLRGGKWGDCQISTHRTGNRFLTVYALMMSGLSGGR